MKHIRNKLRQERGQVLIMFVGIFTVIAIAGVIAVDFGLWLSERRGAQTDADLSSLAGAHEYELCLAVGCVDGDGNASAAANDWFELNNESGNATPVNIIAPDGPYCVSVDAQHASKALFGTVFGGIAPDIGAHAKACAGGITSVDGGDGQGIVPIAMGTNNDPCFLNGQPYYTAYCLIESGSCSGGGGGVGDVASHRPSHNPPGQQTDTPTPTSTNTPTRTNTRTPTNTPTPGGPPTATPTPLPVPTGEPPCNPHGILDLQAGSSYCSDSGGSGDIVDLIENGATGTCRVNEGDPCDPDNNGPWYDCVAVQTGNTNNVLRGIRNRLANQGPCDTDGDGYESFGEAVDLISGSGSTGLYEAVTCSDGSISARIITIIVLDTNPDPGNDGYPIRAFAALYLLGCWDGREDPPTADTDPEDFDQACENQGHQEVYGTFLKLTFSNGDIATPPPGGGTPPPGTLFGIALVE